MWKKLLIFSLTFCLGLISLLLFNSFNKKASQSIVSNPTVSNTTETLQTTSQNPTNFVSIADDFFYRFQNAIEKNDKQTVVSLINFPVEVQFVNKQNKPYFKKFRNDAEFLRNYDEIFDALLKQHISEQETKRLLFSTGREVFTQRSEIIMKPFYKNNSQDFEIKIGAINKLYSSYK
jgi:hypothetical protein